jgi:hypothetical protein
VEPLELAEDPGDRVGRPEDLGVLEDEPDGAVDGRALAARGAEEGGAEQEQRAGGPPSPASPR